MGRNLTSQMVHYTIVKMTIQIVQYPSSKKNHPSQARQVQINLSMLTRWSIDICPNGVLD
jgi:hypothetical protein